MGGCESERRRLVAQTKIQIPTCAGPALLDMLGRSKFGTEKSAFALHGDFRLPCRVRSGLW